MAWKAIDRISPAADDAAAPVLDEAVKAKIRAFFPRYPTKRAVLLPALHVVQDAYGYISHRAMRDVAELLEIPPAQVLDTASFYSHFWTHPKGKKLIVCCRSLSCELTGGESVAEAITRQLGVGEHGTTADGKYTFVTEECLGACEHGPCLLIGEKLHERVKAEDVPRLLADAENDRLEVPRSTIYDGPTEAERKKAEKKKDEAVIGTTSDVQEMREA
jgi:NADH-quinone oxidoreductase subunit E